MAASLAALACSSCGGGGGGETKVSCLEQTAPSHDCYQCGQSNCGSQITTVESACAAYIDCICPGGTFSASAASSSSCKADLGGSCQGADATFTQCIQQSCGSVCPAPDAG